MFIRECPGPSRYRSGKQRPLEMRPFPANRSLWGEKQALSPHLLDNPAACWIQLSLSRTGVRDAPFADGPADLALHGPAVERRVAGLGSGFAGAVAPLGLGVEDDHVGIAANDESAAALQAQQRCRSEERRVGKECR